MKQVTLSITDNKYALFLEFIQNLKFIKKIEEIKEISEPEPTKQEILEGIREAMQEVKLIKAGKAKGIPARELLKEL